MRHVRVSGVRGIWRSAREEGGLWLRWLIFTHLLVIGGAFALVAGPLIEVSRLDGALALALGLLLIAVTVVVREHAMARIRSVQKLPPRRRSYF